MKTWVQFVETNDPYGRGTPYGQQQSGANRQPDSQRGQASLGREMASDAMKTIADWIEDQGWDLLPIPMRDKIKWVVENVSKYGTMAFTKPRMTGSPYTDEPALDQWRKGGEAAGKLGRRAFLGTALAAIYGGGALMAGTQKGREMAGDAIERAAQWLKSQPKPAQPGKGQPDQKKIPEPARFKAPSGFEQMSEMPQLWYKMSRPVDRNGNVWFKMTYATDLDGARMFRDFLTRQAKGGFAQGLEELGMMQEEKEQLLWPIQRATGIPERDMLLQVGVRGKTPPKPLGGEKIGAEYAIIFEVNFEAVGESGEKIMAKFGK